MRSLLAALFVLSTAVMVPIQAQTSSVPASLAPGARVRVTHPGEGTRIATVVALTADTLALQWARGADTARLPLDQVTQIEISRGMRPGNRLARTGVGFLLGTGAGLLLGVASARDCSGQDIACSLTEGTGVMVVGVLGGATGAVIGALTSGQHEQWDRVPLSSRHVGVSVLPAIGGRGLALRVSLSPAAR